MNLKELKEQVAQYDKLKADLKREVEEETIYSGLVELFDNCVVQVRLINPVFHKGKPRCLLVAYKLKGKLIEMEFEFDEQQLRFQDGFKEFFKVSMGRVVKRIIGDMMDSKTFFEELAGLRSVFERNDKI